MPLSPDRASEHLYAQLVGEQWPRLVRRLVRLLVHEASYRLRLHGGSGLVHHSAAPLAVVRLDRVCPVPSRVLHDVIPSAPALEAAWRSACSRPSGDRLGFSPEDELVSCWFRLLDLGGSFYRLLAPDAYGAHPLGPTMTRGHARALRQGIADGCALMDRLRRTYPLRLDGSPEEQGMAERLALPEAQTQVWDPWPVPRDVRVLLQHPARSARAYAVGALSVLAPPPGPAPV